MVSLIIWRSPTSFWLLRCIFRNPLGTLWLHFSVQSPNAFSDVRDMCTLFQPRTSAYGVDGDFGPRSNDADSGGDGLSKNIDADKPHLKDVHNGQALQQRLWWRRRRAQSQRNWDLTSWIPTHPSHPVGRSATNLNSLGFTSRVYWNGKHVQVEGQLEHDDNKALRGCGLSERYHAC